MVTRKVCVCIVVLGTLSAHMRIFEGKPRPAGNAQDPSGYEAALDPWLEALFPAVTQAGFEGAGGTAHSSALASKFIVEVSTGGAAAADRHLVTNGIAATPETRSTNGGDKAEEELQLELFRDACTAAAHFSELAATASGMTAPAAAAPQQSQDASAARDPSGVSNGSADALNRTHASTPNGATSANGNTHTELKPQQQPRPARSWEPHWATVAETRRLTAADHWQVVQHLELDTSAPQATCIQYAPGDLMTVWPWVAPARALEFLERVGIAQGAPALLAFSVPASLSNSGA